MIKPLFDENYYYGLVSENEQGVLVIDDPVLFKMRISKILKDINWIFLNFVPLSTCFVLTYFPNVLNLYFMSKNEVKIDVSIIGTAIIILNITGIFSLMSINNEIGATIAVLHDKPNITNYYNKYTIGLYIQRGIVLGTLFCIPWFIFLLFIKYFFYFFFGDWNFETKMTKYLIYLIPSLYFNFGFDLIRSLMTALNMLYIPSSFMVLTIFFHYCICILIQSDHSLELNNLALLKNVTDFLNVFLILLYSLSLKSTKRILNIQWTINSFKNLTSHLNFWNILKYYFELSSYEIMHIIAFFEGNLEELVPYFIIMVIQNMNLLINRGYGKVLEILVSKSVKDGCCNRVKNQTIIGIFLCLILALLQYSAFFLLKTFAIHVLLIKENHKTDFQYYCNFYFLKVFLDVLLITLTHLMKALKKEKIIFRFHIIFFYLFQFFLSFYLIFIEKLHINGIWFSTIIIESAMIIIIFLYFLFILDWKKEINIIGYNKLKDIINRI